MCVADGSYGVQDVNMERDEVAMNFYWKRVSDFQSPRDWWWLSTFAYFWPWLLVGWERKGRSVGSLDG